MKALHGKQWTDQPAELAYLARKFVRLAGSRPARQQCILGRSVGVLRSMIHRDEDDRSNPAEKKDWRKEAEKNLEAGKLQRRFIS